MRTGLLIAIIVIAATIALSDLHLAIRVCVSVLAFDIIFVMFNKSFWGSCEPKRDQDREIFGH